MKLPFLGIDLPQKGFFVLGPGLFLMRKLLVAGAVNPATRAPESQWSNRLVLPGLDVVVHLKLDSETKIDFLSETVSMRARNLDDAVLTGAVLRKVDLTGAGLRGALLTGAKLQKAKLGCGYWLDPKKRGKEGKSAEPLCAQLQGASLREAFVWRADLRFAETSLAWIDSVRSDPTLACNESGTNFICRWTETTLRDLKEEIGRVVPEGRYREAALTRLAPRLRPPPAAPESEEAAIDAWWNNPDTRPHSPTREAFEAEAAKHWQQVGCQPDGAPHIVTQLASRLTGSFPTPFDNDSPQLAALANAFLAKDCAGAAGLSDALRAQLQRLIPPKPPAP